MAYVGEVLALVTALGATTRLGAIAGIDRGTIVVTPSGGAGTNTATVGAVVVARSLLSLLGSAGTNAGNMPFGYLTLTNTTTITATAVTALVAAGASTNGGAADATFAYQLVEYNA